jgi:formylaminopyrimidine deformylase / aminopyrimidine aminohydrolase
VKHFVRFVGSVLAKAPDEHQALILDGVAALKSELQWFQAKAAERRLDLHVAPQPACVAYCAWLQGLGASVASVTTHVRKRDLRWTVAPPPCTC